MDAIAITVIMGASLLILPLLMRLPSIRKKYEKLDDRKLIDTRVTARMMAGVMVGLAILEPLPFAFLVSLLKNPEPLLLKCFLCITIFMAFVFVMSFWMFFEMVRLTTAEIEFRKFQKEKAGISEPTTPG